MDGDLNTLGKVSKRDEDMMKLDGAQDGVELNSDQTVLNQDADKETIKTEGNDVEVLSYHTHGMGTADNAIVGALNMQLDHPNNPVSFEIESFAVTIPADFVNAELPVAPARIIDIVYSKKMSPEQQSEFIGQAIKLGPVWHRITQARSKVVKLPAKEEVDAAWQTIDFDQLESDLREFLQNKDYLRGLIGSDDYQHIFEWATRTQNNFGPIKDKFSVQGK